MHYLEWQWYNYDSNFTEICSQESNWQWAGIGLDNGLAPDRRQAIIWTNADPIHRRIYAALWGDELTHCSQIGILGIQVNNNLEWMPQNLVDVKSTLVLVMAWCRQATRHYPNQCWLRYPMLFNSCRSTGNLFQNVNHPMARPNIRAWFVVYFLVQNLILYGRRAI